MLKNNWTESWQSKVISGRIDLNDTTDMALMKNIKKLFCLVSLFLMASVRQSLADDDTNVWGTVACDTQISIALDGSATEIKTGESVSLDISVKNVSTNEAFNVYEDDNDLSFTIIAPSGKDVSPVPSKNGTSSSGAVLHLPAQQTKQFEYYPNCKFDETGVYTITAKVPIRDSCVAASNPLSVTVVGDETTPPGNAASPTNGM
jgi:hypothetical protein